MWLTFGGIVALVALVGLVDYPKGPDIHLGSWNKILKVQLGLDLQGGTSLLYTADVSNIATEERQSALDGVRDVIERRINAFGVSEPNIQTVREGEEWRVLVELPGVTDITEAVNRIGETPLLEFKKEGPPPEIPEEVKQQIRDENEKKRVTAQETLDALRAGGDFDAKAREVSDDPGSKEKGGDLGEFSQGDMVPAFDDVVFNKATVGEVYPELVQSDFGYHIIRVDERAEAPAQDAENAEPRKAKAHHILFRTQPENPQFSGPNYVDTGLTGEQLERADVVLDPTTGLPTVSISFNSEGKDLFATLTRENLDKTIAIYLDGTVISAPVVQSEITNGEAVITGNFSLDEAKELAQRLNAGALPVPVELISQQNIGPSLGQQSVERSVFAGLVGMAALVLFMILYYRLPGALAVLALGLYLLITLAIFKWWPVTLTMAGIAGFILSVGMAVDANVLIFERMKEELRNGKPLNQCFDDGFRRAWTSIRDSNYSTLITCLILYWFGSSLIRGFAITLAIGTVVSIFSAITVTRTLLHLVRVKNTWWYGVKRSQ